MDEREERRRRRRRRRWLNPTRILLITVVAALVIVFGVSAKTIVDLWSEKGDLEKVRPTKFPEIPVSLERNTEVFRHPLL